MNNFIMGIDVGLSKDKQAVSLLRMVDYPDVIVVDDISKEREFNTKATINNFQWLYKKTMEVIKNSECEGK